MPDVNLPGLNGTEDIKKMSNAYMMMVKELRYLLANLDSQNVTRLDAEKTVFENLEAGTVITNNIITNSLYANYGYIAELTVDELYTHDKVTKFKSSDTSDINWIKIYDQKIEYITSQYAGGSPDYEQAEDRNGNPLYWYDSSEASVTTEVTAYPVYQYKYNEYIKISISFVLVGSDYVPKFQLGTGTGTGDNGKAFIWKDATGLRLEYINTSGDTLYFSLSESGMSFSEDVNANAIVDQNSSNNKNVWVGTEAQYLALTPDANTIYFIT